MKSKLNQEQQEIVERLEKEHQDIRPYKLKDGRLVVIRACTPAERLLMVQGITAKHDRNGNSRVVEAHSEIAPEVMLYPESREERIAILRRWPALNDRFAQDSFDMAEGGIEELGND
jgi:hypothetical protein